MALSRLAVAAALVLGCGAPSKTCTPRDAALDAKVEVCEARILHECKGVPYGECRAHTDCSALLDARCDR